MLGLLFSMSLNEDVYFVYIFSVPNGKKSCLTSLKKIIFSNIIMQKQHNVTGLWISRTVKSKSFYCSHFVVVTPQDGHGRFGRVHRDDL